MSAANFDVLQSLMQVLSRSWTVTLFDDELIVIRAQAQLLPSASSRKKPLGSTFERTV